MLIVSPIERSERSCSLTPARPPNNTFSAGRHQPTSRPKRQQQNPRPICCPRCASRSSSASPSASASTTATRSIPVLLGHSAAMGKLELSERENNEKERPLSKIPRAFLLNRSGVDVVLQRPGENRLCGLRMRQPYEEQRSSHSPTPTSTESSWEAGRRSRYREQRLGILILLLWLGV